MCHYSSLSGTESNRFILVSLIIIEFNIGAGCPTCIYTADNKAVTVPNVVEPYKLLKTYRESNSMCSPVA